MNGVDAERAQSLTRAGEVAGQFEPVDIALSLYHGFCLPGDYVLSLLVTYLPSSAPYLELGPDHQRAVLSAAVAGVMWLLALLLLKSTYRLVLDIDRVATAWVARLYGAFLLPGRIVRRRLGIALRARALRRQARALASQRPQEVGLDDLELAVLRSHAEVTPGYTLTASEIASALGVRTSQAQRALDTLRKLQLVTPGFGTSDGEGGYRLSGPGEAFLAALVPGCRMATDGNQSVGRPART